MTTKLIFIIINLHLNYRNLNQVLLSEPMNPSGSQKVKGTYSSYNTE